MTPIGALGNLFPGGHLAWRVSDRPGSWPLRRPGQCQGQRSLLGQLRPHTRPRLCPPGWEQRPQETPSGRAEEGAAAHSQWRESAPHARRQPRLPRAWGAGAGQRYTTSSVSHWVGNSNQLAARRSRLTPPPPALSCPGNAAPHSHAPRRERTRLRRRTQYLLGHFPHPPMWATFQMPTRGHFAASRNTFNYLQNTPKRESSWLHLPAPHGSGLPLAHLDPRLLVSLRDRGSAFQRSRPEASGSQSGSSRPCSGMNTLAAGNYNSQHPSGHWPQAIA